MRRLALITALLTVACGFLGTADSAVVNAPIWRGDFETGTLSQWDAAQFVGPNGVKVQRSLVREGRYAARFEVKPGDHWAGLLGERAEVLKGGLGEQGNSDSYWAWSTFFPTSFISDHSAGFQMFAQWHSASNTSYSGLSFQVDRERLVVRYDGGTPANDHSWRSADLGPLLRGAWQDFIVHIRWGSGVDGYLDIWRNGKAVAWHASGANIATGQGTYAKLGFYRPAEPWTTIVYDDGTKFGRSLEEVDGTFELRFDHVRGAHGRVWFHLRSFAMVNVRVGLKNNWGRTVATTATTNTNGDLWLSVPCGAIRRSRSDVLTLFANAAVDHRLPPATRVTGVSLPDRVCKLSREGPGSGHRRHGAGR